MVWQEATDEASGVPFWHNAETGESTWDRPAAWVKQTDPSSGAEYWWNTETDRVSWTDPSSAAAPAPSPPMVSGRAPPSAAPDDAARESADEEPTLSFSQMAKPSFTSGDNPMHESPLERVNPVRAHEPSARMMRTSANPMISKAELFQF